MGCKASKAITYEDGDPRSPSTNAGMKHQAQQQKQRHQQQQQNRRRSAPLETSPTAATVEGGGATATIPVANRVKHHDQHHQQNGLYCPDDYLTTLSSRTGASDDGVDRALEPIRSAVSLPSISASLQHYRGGYVPHPQFHTRTTPLHMAVQILDAAEPHAADGLEDVIQRLIVAHPDAVYTADAAGNLPLHYAIAPSQNTWRRNTTSHAEGLAAAGDAAQSNSFPPKAWRKRSEILSLLLDADTKGVSVEYLHRNNVVFVSAGGTPNDQHEADSASMAFQGGCSPLYRALQCLPDDFTMPSPTVEFILLLVQASILRPGHAMFMAGVGNAADGDKPLALLYRRFTRQFDLAEKFFSGDNSRPAVVEHRRKYKTAAGNTWKLIEILLKAQPEDEEVRHFRTVHRAVQVETPPDLLRYIVETNAEDLTVPDEAGNLPLHYAAMSKPASHFLSTSTSSTKKNDYRIAFPAFYSKYVMDELLYKFPEAAAQPNAAGLYPLALAVKSGKHWIGGGIKSLYDAFPEALKQINLEEHTNLKRVLSMESASSGGGDTGDDATMKEEKEGDVLRDEPHDAIMLVQQDNVDISEVVTSMWAHEEDAGVQLLGCIAIYRLLSTSCKSKWDVQRIALTAIPAVVNAMKAHPNEVVVQEKACRALKDMAVADGKREISFVASGAVAAIVGAMQAHVSDAAVQQEACAALAAIIHYGGADRATIVASVSGLTALLNALAAHPTIVTVQRYACQALVELTAFSNNKGSKSSNHTTNTAATASSKAMLLMTSEEANLPDLPQQQAEPLLDAARDRFPKECGALVDILIQRLIS